MPAILGSGEHRYRVVENWAKLPDGWSLTDAASVAVDSKDRIYVFNRGDHPMVVFDREGNFITSWGEGLFNRAHGLHIDADDNLYCTDDGDHTVRKCTTDGKVLLTIGIPNKPAPFMSGEPFHRCTHTALSPKGEIYVSDGYGNACVHKYSPDGKLLKTWGEPGTDPGQFNIVHNIATDADGWVYVADRENHRVQVFDGNGKYETQWNNLHRPCALCRCGSGKQPNFIIGELGPGMAVNRKVPNLGPRLSIVDSKGKRIARLGGEDGPGLEAGKFLAPHGIAMDSKGDYLCRRSRRHRLEDQLSGHADAAGGSGEPLSAEAGEDPGLNASPIAQSRSIDRESQAFADRGTAAISRAWLAAPAFPLLDKARNALHNPVTLPVVCRAHAASQLTWGSGALLERTCLARRLAGTGAERGFPAAELLPAVSLVVAGRDQGGVSRSRQYRRALRPRGAQPDASRSSFRAWCR